jgi:SAM-dependent methyltransferase
VGHPLFLQGPHSGKARVGAVSIVGTSTAIEPVTTANGFPRTEAFVPPNEFRLLVEVLVHEHNFVKFTRDFHQDERRSAWKAVHLKRQTTDGLVSTPCCDVFHSGLNVSIGLPVGVERRRECWNADVVAQRRNDGGFPRRFHAVLQPLSVDHHHAASTVTPLHSPFHSPHAMRAATDVFSEWAGAGRDEGMERGHAPAVSEMLAFGLAQTAELGRSFRAIDVGCGNGWVVRQLQSMPFCTVAEGVDGAAGMIDKARSIDPEGLYHHAMLPNWRPDGRVDLLVSMEVLYYLEDPAAMLREFRTAWLNPAGWAVVGIDHYREHEASLTWPEDVGVQMTTLSEDEWLRAWTSAGFTNITTWRAAGDPGTLVIAGQAPST